MSDITLVVSAPGPTVELTADAPGAVTVTVNVVAVSAAFGVPEIAPVAGASVRLAGSAGETLNT